MSTSSKIPLSNFIQSETFSTAVREAMKDGRSNLTTLGFSFASAFIGTLIYKKYPKSTFGRTLAVFFGADVKKLDVNEVLKKLKDTEYFKELGYKMQCVWETGNITPFAEFLEVSEQDALNIFLEVKPVVLDSELYRKISEINNSVNDGNTFLKTQLPKLESFFQNIPTKLDELTRITQETHTTLIDFQKKFEDSIKKISTVNKRNQRNKQISKSLSIPEKYALAFMMTDPQSATRGVWLYPLHQQLTYRGFPDSDVTLILSSLAKKGFIKHVEVPHYDDFRKKQTTASACKITDKGIRYIQQNQDSIPKLKETYIYGIRLYGSKKSNTGFLEHIRNLDFVQAQTRFVNESNKKLCQIAVFAYKPVDRKDIEHIAKINKTKIYSFIEDN